jgi:hypothetical protein
MMEQQNLVTFLIHYPGRPREVSLDKTTIGTGRLPLDEFPDLASFVMISSINRPIRTKSLE